MLSKALGPTLARMPLTTIKCIYNILIVVKGIRAKFVLNYLARMPLTTIKCVYYIHLRLVLHAVRYGDGLRGRIRGHRG